MAEIQQRNNGMGTFVWHIYKFAALEIASRFVWVGIHDEVLLSDIKAMWCVFSSVLMAVKNIERGWNIFFDHREVFLTLKMFSELVDKVAHIHVFFL